MKLSATSIFGLLVLSLFPTFLFSQKALEFKLQLLEPGKWGVFVRPDSTISPSLITITGSAQVTVVMPLNFSWNSLQGTHGAWTSNSTVNGPIENPTKSYVSFGLTNEYPHIDLISGQETLLFTFKAAGQNCPDNMHLINNTNDPFKAPNSLLSNPGNEMTVFDPIGAYVYEYKGNYATAAWNCHDNDGDGILNAFEDTNGNGIYDPGVDASDLNHSCTVDFLINPQNLTICAGSASYMVASAVSTQDSFSFGWQYSALNDTVWTDIDFSGGSIFSNVMANMTTLANDTLFIANVSGMDGFRFRAVANATVCSAVFSNYAILSVQGPLSVTDQPDDLVECSGNPALFSAIIANPGTPGSVILNWQLSIDNGATWANLVNNSNYNGTTAINGNGLSTLSIANVAGLHNALFRLAYRTSTCNVQFTDVARLTVGGPITVTAQPVDRTLCTGGSTTFTSTADVDTAGTLNYQWQVSSDNGLNFSNIGAGTDGGVYANFNTTTLTINDVTGLYSRNYRLAFSTAECNQVYSNKALLKVEGPIAITDQPDDIVSCSGEAVNFYVGAINESLQDTSIFYQWQESTDGGLNWHFIQDDTLYNGGLSNQLFISYSSGFDGNQYRCIISTLTCAQIISDAAILHIDGPLTVVDEPDNFISCYGNAASFQANIINNSNSPLIYQWEYSPNNGVSWSDVPNNANISGATTTTLVINNVAGMSGFRWRLRFGTANCNAIWTNYAVLSVQGPINFLTQPQSKTVCSGNGTNFSVTTANAGQGTINYQWQASPTGSGGPWINLSNTSIYNGTNTANLSIANVAGLNGYCFRVNIQTAACNAISSNTACLMVEGPITFALNPSDAISCDGESVQFHGEADGSNNAAMQYQWQIALDGINWSNIMAAGTNGFSGWDSPTLEVGNSAGLGNAQFRLTASTNACSNAASTPATLTAVNCGSACVKLKLQLLPDSSGWAVMAKPFDSYVPTPGTAITDGRITLVAPASFVLDGFSSLAGNWSPTNVQANVPGHPGRKYITFELTGQQAVPVQLDLNLATSLFQFGKTGDCPDSLYILESFSGGTPPNLLSGQDPAYTEGFGLCGVYARKNWRCHNAASTPGGPIIIETEDDFGGSPQAGSLKASGHLPDGRYLTAYPNPAGDNVNIVLANPLAEGRNSLALWDLQGRKQMEILLEGTTAQLDLSGLPAGVYFLSLAQNGRVVERQELVKK